MSINEQPLVTVYIPTFNRLELLQRAVESVCNQTYKNLEIIVVDDCSTDGTQEYLEQLAKEDSRVRYFLKEKNSGACVSRNIAIENAKGEYITGLDDDDYFKNNRISVFLEHALKDKNNGYYSLSDIKIDDNKFIRGRKKIFKKSKISKGADLLKQNFIGNQIFIRTSILSAAMGFDASFKAWQDMECWYNLLQTQKIYFQLISQSTQVIDISHSHERISTKKISHVKNAFLNFVEKHNLSPYEKFILYGQLINYEPKGFSLVHKWTLFVLTGQIFYLKKIFVRK